MGERYAAVIRDEQAAILADLGHRFAQARADVEDVRTTLGAEIRLAHAAGWSEARIAKAAGVARDTVRKALGKGKVT
jgi:hypothetical protein